MAWCGEELNSPAFSRIVAAVVIPTPGMEIKT
jgi:hypothetical protein